MWALLLALLSLGVAFVLYDAWARGSRRKGRPGGGTRRRMGGGAGGDSLRTVQVARKNPIGACQAVCEIVGRDFPIDEAPRLPLVTCSRPSECTCYYIKSGGAGRQVRPVDTESPLVNSERPEQQRRA